MKPKSPAQSAPASATELKWPPHLIVPYTSQALDIDGRTLLVSAEQHHPTLVLPENTCGVTTQDEGGRFGLLLERPRQDASYTLLWPAGLDTLQDARMHAQKQHQYGSRVLLILERDANHTLSTHPTLLQPNPEQPCAGDPMQAQYSNATFRGVIRAVLNGKVAFDALDGDGHRCQRLVPETELTLQGGVWTWDRKEHHVLRDQGSEYSLDFLDKGGDHGFFASHESHYHHNRICWYSSNVGADMAWHLAQTSRNEFRVHCTQLLFLNRSQTNIRTTEMPTHGEPTPPPLQSTHTAPSTPPPARPKHPLERP